MKFKLKGCERAPLFYIFIFFTFFSLAQEPNCWQKLFENKKEIIGKDTYGHLLQQCNVFRNNTAPNIVHDDVKSIPIIESYEEVIDIHHMNHPRIQMMPQPATPFASPRCNSGLPSATKMRKKLFECLCDMLEKIDELAPYFGYASGQISIRVFEGLRDIETQAQLFENKQREIREQFPYMMQDEIFNETCKWISPVHNNVPVHSTGAAVDIRLWDEKEQTFLDMGPFGAIWGANPNAPTFSESITQEQMNNRLLLVASAHKAGLTNYVYEFWHYSVDDRYAAYWNEPLVENRFSRYGSL